MIPPYFLSVTPGDSVLDTCAAPGSKTAQILEMLNGHGAVTANDCDPRRCHALVHQLQRVGTTNAMVVCDQAQFLDFGGIKFDRVLCDVPCSGDGTLRKNPAAGANWRTRGGGSLHGVQRAILKRGIELTKLAGFVVYSTCSMNPIEDEAVVNSVLLELEGAVEIVDASGVFQDIKRRPGLTTWPVFDTGSDELVSFQTAAEVPTERQQFAHATMFPQPQVPGLERGMRFYPQDADSGGFFVIVLRKVREFERISKPPAKKPKDLREAPYLPIETVSPELLAELKDLFGLEHAFPSDQLFVRDERSVRTIYYIAQPMAGWIREHGSAALRIVSCGSPIFVWRGSGSQVSSLPYPAMEGLPVVMQYATRRVFAVRPEEMKKLLLAGHKALAHRELSRETFEQFRDDEQKGCILRIPDTMFAYPGMTFKGSICVYLRKDLIPVETRKLIVAYPELGADVQIEEPPEPTEEPDGES
jgi:hypothetical protein